MRAIFWNIRGFGHTGRRTLLKKYLHKERIDCVALQETIKSDFSFTELKSIDPRERFVWQWVPANGHSGGLLLGLDHDKFLVTSWTAGTYFLSAKIANKADLHIWELCVVYGPADHARSAPFLEEIGRFTSMINHPLVIGGDFNLIRSEEDKSSGNINWPRINLFNNAIADMELKEIERVGARFTWTNRQLNPIRSVLDRVFISAAWELLFPLSNVRVETRLGSDHSPLIFSTGEDLIQKKARFFVEIQWFEEEGFPDTLKNKWCSWVYAFATPRGTPRGPMDYWHGISVKCRQYLRGWGNNRGRDTAVLKADTLREIILLDTRADVAGLSEAEWQHRYVLENTIIKIYKAEEIYWRQRGRFLSLTKGDINTSFFHAVANGNKRRTTIPRLITPSGDITAQVDLVQHIYEYYTELIGTERPRWASLAPNVWDASKMVSDADNAAILLSFSDEEIEGALKAMKTDTAPGPDGFPVAFFKKCWPWLKPLIFAIIKGFALGQVNISRINYAILALIPKKVGADKISQFRPIALINVIFKLVAKCYALRLGPVAQKIVDRAQTAFLKDRVILEGVLCLNEIIHEVKKKKLPTVILKLDFEKAYDKISWSFLSEVLHHKGFDAGFIHKIMQLVQGGQTAIAINGEVGKFFRNKCGLRQGDPISPLLFDIVADSISVMLDKACTAGHLKGVVPHLIPGGISHLQYADDTVLTFQPDDQSVATVKTILICFEAMSGLKINYSKSQVFTVAMSDDEGTDIANALNCQKAELPMTYLGLPCADRALTEGDWDPTTLKVAARCDPWEGKLMSSAARLTLTNACLSAIPTFAMGLFLLGEGIHGKFDKIRARFFWEADAKKRKYHMIRWADLCRPKKQGGLGITNTRFMNLALISKWIWKLAQNDDGLWAKLLKAKYFPSRSFFNTNSKGSQIWNGIQKCKEVFFLGAKFTVGNGRDTKFWLCAWCTEKPLYALFPSLFSIAAYPNAMASEIFATGEAQIGFLRDLSVQEQAAFVAMSEILSLVSVSEDRDSISWSLEASGRFSVKSLYAKLVSGPKINFAKPLWAARIPPRVKIFIWQAALDRLPSALNLQKRNGPGNGNCALCGAQEDANHIIFNCAPAVFLWSGVREIFGPGWNPTSMAGLLTSMQNTRGQARRIAWRTFGALAWALWTTRNKLAIEGIIPSHPANYIFKWALFFQQWRPLGRREDSDAASEVLRKINGLHASHRST